MLSNPLSSKSISPDGKGKAPVPMQPGRADLLSSSTGHAGDNLATQTVNTSARRMMDSFIDPEVDTAPEIRAKEEVVAVLHREPRQRSRENLLALGNFLQRYKFFEGFKRGSAEDTYQAVMRVVKVAALDAGEFVIQQGDEGDRFYVVLKGDTSVHKAYFQEVQKAEAHFDLRFKVHQYLWSLLQNMDWVFWQRVPYRADVERFLKKLRRYMADKGLPAGAAQVVEVPARVETASPRSRGKKEREREGVPRERQRQQ